MMVSKNAYVLYRDRPEWSDVIPVQQDEESRHILRIAYSERFTDAHDFLRAVLLKDERSERALDLTSEVLSLNPANYTVWEYRRRILSTLSADQNADLRFVGKLIDDHSKNYQLWHHRQWLVKNLADKKSDDPEEFQQYGANELDFIASILADDFKNYHAWQHRRWVVNFFKISPASELEYTSDLILRDVYNNSAWNHRFTVVSMDEGLSPGVLQREVSFAQEMIRLAPRCESAWNYLYGLLIPPAVVVRSTAFKSDCAFRRDAATRVVAEVVDETTSGSETVSPGPTSPASSNAATTQLLSSRLCEMRQFAEELSATNSSAAFSPSLHSFLIEVYTDIISLMKERKEKQQSSTLDAEKQTSTSHVDGSNKPTETTEELLELASNTCERLATELDRIRAHYWQYRARQLLTLVHGPDASSPHS